MPAIAIPLLIAAGLAAQLEPEDAQCRVIHYAPDGTRTETAPTKAYTGPRPASASVSSRGSTSASSSVSVSASSSSSGRGSTTTTASRPGRSITRTYDNKGCVVVVDERPAPGGD